MILLFNGITTNLYAFPLFRLLPRCLQKLRAEVAALRAQPWFPMMLNMARDTMWFRARKDNLTNTGEIRGKTLNNISLIAGICC